MSIAELETLYAAAIAALDAGQYETAIIKANAIKLRIATMPSVAQRQGARTEFTAQWVDSFIAECRRLLAESSGTTRKPGFGLRFQQIKPVYR